MTLRGRQRRSAETTCVAGLYGLQKGSRGMRFWTMRLSAFVTLATIFASSVAVADTPAWNGEESPARGKGWSDPSTSELKTVAEDPHAGANCLRIDFKGAGVKQVGWNWFGWSPPEAGVDAKEAVAFVFWIQANRAEGNLQLKLADNRKGESASVDLATQGFLAKLPLMWQKVRVPLATFGDKVDLARLSEMRLATDAKDGLTIWIDDLSFEGPTAQAVKRAGSVVKVRVETDRALHAISPLIYGASSVGPEKAAELGLTTVRWGGNRSSRYNWRVHADNAGSDWYFLNGPAGQWTTFDAGNREKGMTSYITVPMLPWVAKGPTGHGYSVAKYGPQKKVEPYDPDYGNGIRTNGLSITTNDPRDTSVASNPAFQAEGLRTLRSAPKAPPRIYGLDNEMMLWHSTHRDVHPRPVTYDEALQVGREYARAIKRVDPSGLVAGPCAWGWPDLSYSAADEGNDQYATHADRRAHGNVPFLDWYLAGMKKESDAAGRRLLDLVDVHCYPQGAGVHGSDSDSPALRALRVRSTRALWDPKYRDESWIGQPVMLIPRIRAIVNKNFPGTKLCLGEYSWGGDHDASGAIAQAEILGIFAREGVEYAYYWAGLGGVQHFAFQLFRNPDGRHKGFGETYLESRSDDPENVSVFAAKRADGALTVIVINKELERVRAVDLDLAKRPGTKGTLFRLANPPGPIRAESFPSTTSRLTLQPLTAVLVVIPAK